MTYTQIQSRLIRVVRSVRKAVRTGQTAGEKLERELDRLIKRQHGQLLQPNDLVTAVKLFQAWSTQVGRVPAAFAAAQDVFITPVIP